MNCLYILKINPLSVASLENIFSPFLRIVFSSCLWLSLLCKIFRANPRLRASVTTQRNPPAMQETPEIWVQSWVRKIPWRRGWQPTPIFLPGESHGQRGDWWITVHGVTKSQTPLSNYTYTHTICIFKMLLGDFPGGPVVKTLSFHCRGCEFNPWLGN